MADEEIRELVDRRRRRNWAIVGGVVLLVILAWAWWDNRPSGTQLVVRVSAYEDPELTRPTTAFDVLIDGRATASTVAEGGVREVRLSRPDGTEIGVSVRSTTDPDLTKGPRFHHVDSRLLPDVGEGVRAIEERFSFGTQRIERDLTVRVLDEKGEPLPGVYVHLDGELAGATSSSGEITFTLDVDQVVDVMPLLTGRTFVPSSRRSTSEEDGVLSFSREALPAAEFTVGVRVVREDGRPAPEVPIYLDGVERLSTDAEGRASFTMSILNRTRIEPRLPGRSFTPTFQVATDDQSRLPPFILMDVPAADPGTPDVPAVDPGTPDVPEGPALLPVTFTSAEAGTLVVNDIPRDLVGKGPWTLRLEEGMSVFAQLRPTVSAERRCGPRSVGPFRVRRDLDPVQFANFDCRDLTSESADAGLDFGTDYLAAEEHVRKHLDDDVSIRFDEPASAADHEMYGRLLWIRGQGYERRGLIQDAIRDLERSYEYRPSATTAIDLLSAQYEADPCGSLERLAETEEKAVQQGVSHESREKLRAFTVFMYHCRYRRSSDADERALWEERLCDAISEYRRGVTRGGTRRYQAEVGDVSGRIQCDRRR